MERSKHHKKRHHKSSHKQHYKSHHRKDSFSRMPINDIKRINKSKRMEDNFQAKVLHDKPYIVKLKNLLTHKEIDELLKIAKRNGFERSNMVANNELIISDYRT